MSVDSPISIADISQGDKLQGKVKKVTLSGAIVDVGAPVDGLLHISEIAHYLFGINAEDEPERARRVHDSHLVRAHWVAEQGYRELLSNG